MAPLLLSLPRSPFSSPDRSVFVFLFAQGELILSDQDGLKYPSTRCCFFFPSSSGTDLKRSFHLVGVNDLLMVQGIRKISKINHRRYRLFRSLGQWLEHSGKSANLPFLWSWVRILLSCTFPSSFLLSSLTFLPN